MKIIILDLQKKIKIRPQRIKRTALRVLAEESAKLSGELTVSFVNDAKIKELNRRYHKRNFPTDVLAFDLSRNNDELLADIVISVDTASRNAVFFKTSAEFETSLYVIHGLLHLLGYRDRTKTQKYIMHKKENRYAAL